MKIKSVASRVQLIIILTYCFFSQGCEIFKYISGSQQATSSNGLTDIANMFNERGYYKSNVFSFDEQEIINDFNGNLMYNIPLYNYALSGDLNFNLSLNYNGSVGHQIIVGKK